MSNPLPLPNASRDLLGSLIDDASMLGVNQPSLSDAVAGYRSARAAAAAPVLGTFLCPASRLIELSGELVATMAATEAPWPITVVVDGDLGAAVTALHAFSAAMEPAARIVLAARPGLASSAEATTAFAMPMATLVDVATGPAQDPVVAARFISDSARTGGPFVAWGLDHVMRTADRPGILNMVGAATLAADHASEAALVAVLEEIDPATFRLGRAGLTWRHHTIAAVTLRRVRATVLRSVASSHPTPVVGDLSAMWCADIHRNQ